jgi:hypothetical protein
MRYRINKSGKIVPNGRGLEDGLQKNCIIWFDTQYPKLSQVLFHVANGGSRNKAEAGKLKGMGVRRGVADLFLSVPNDALYAHGLYIECKTPDGTQSKEQKEFEAKVTYEGYLYKICRDVDEFILIVQTYLHKTSHFKNLWAVKLNLQPTPETQPKPIKRPPKPRRATHK